MIDLRNTQGFRIRDIRWRRLHDGRLKIKLTHAQISALDCAGIFEAEPPDAEGELLLRDCIQGDILEIHGQENISTAASAVNELSNAEDALARTVIDRDVRRGHRGASKALGNLATKLWMKMERR